MTPRNTFRGIVDSPNEAKDKQQADIDRHVRIFLSMGGKVQVIENGVSGIPERKGQVQLKIQTEKQKHKKLRVEG